MTLTQNPIDDSENDPLRVRKVTLGLLREILDRKIALDIVLDRSEDFAALDMRDRAFVRMLLTTTLRRLGQIDDLIVYAQDRPDSLKTPIVKHILRLGVTQMFFMDVPDHATVDTSVKLVVSEGMERQKGFVNAVLRTLGRKGAERLKNQDAMRLNTPDWLLQIWIKDYGLRGAAQITQSHMREASLDVTLKDQKDEEHFVDTLDAVALSTGTLRRKQGGNVRHLDGFDKGQWWVQDASAALPAQLFGDIEGQHVVDMCAAPGGKTLQLAAMGAHVTAIDRSANRLKRLDENLERVGLRDSVEVEISDASVWRPVEAPRYILLDAPCSATGTIRRHPDTGYLKSLDDIARLMSIQSRLLTHAADILSVDGLLIYCTCSLQKSEGEEQISEFLDRHEDFIRSPITPEEVGGHADLINDDGDLRILPYHLASEGGMDGFFVSRLKKVL